jgi:hypothetical protein
MDADLTTVHPFLQELNSYLVLDQNAPLFAVLDIQTVCASGGPSARYFAGFHRDRLELTIVNKNATEFRYYNSGFLVMRNGELMRQIFGQVIGNISLRAPRFFYGDQDAIWAYSNTSLFGLLPMKFNCMDIRQTCSEHMCGPETLLFHSHDKPRAVRARQEFSNTLKSLTD